MSEHRLLPFARAASRTLAAVLGGYALALSFTAAASLALLRGAGLARSEALLAAAMSSLVVYLLAMVRAFALRSIARAWIELLGAASVCAALAAWWRA
jgi:hypothetical protein